MGWRGEKMEAETVFHSGHIANKMHKTSQLTENTR